MSDYDAIDYITYGFCAVLILALAPVWVPLYLLGRVVSKVLGP